MVIPRLMRVGVVSPRYGGKGKDHSGVAVREIVRIAKKESAV